MLHFVFPSIYLFISLNPLSFNSLHRFREYHQFTHFVLSPLEIAGKTWKKEEELKGLKAELAALDRKIQLELAPPTEKECKEEEKNTDNVEVVANADIRNKHQHFSKVKI
jgi:hypothetical protein